MNNPYIGITGFTNADQVRLMLDTFQRNKRMGSQRKLHIGVMMSFNTLHGLPSRYTDSFPKNTAIRDIFPAGPQSEIMNCVHYADHRHDPNLRYPLQNAIGFGGPHMNALQLDAVWPDPDEIQEALCGHDHITDVILQVGKHALEKVGDEIPRLLNELACYSETVTHIILDKSMGRGLPLDSDDLLPFLRTIRSELPEYQLVVAGGLGPNTLHLLEPIIEEFPDINIDAEGKLRASGNNIDPLDIPITQDYLAQALQLLK
jgi:hypothetical protein